MREFIRLAGVAILLVVAGCGGTSDRTVTTRDGDVGPTGSGVVVEELEAAEARWLAAGITDYDLVVKNGCFCVMERIGPFEVSVRGGEVAEVHLDSETAAALGHDPNQPFQPIPSLTPTDLFTVEGLFANIRSNLDADRISVSYGEHGNPTLIIIDPDLDTVDDEATITAVLETTPADLSASEEQRQVPEDEEPCPVAPEENGDCLDMTQWSSQQLPYSIHVPADWTQLSADDLADPSLVAAWASPVEELMFGIFEHDLASLGVDGATVSDYAEFVQTQVWLYPEYVTDYRETTTAQGETGVVMHFDAGAGSEVRFLYVHDGKHGVSATFLGPGDVLVSASGLIDPVFQTFRIETS